MKRKLLLLSLMLLLAFSGVVFAAGVNGQYKGKDIVRVTLDGKEIVPDSVPGYLDGSSSMVPLGMLRKMGVTVEWDSKKLTANVKLPTRTVPVLTQPQLQQLSEYVYEIQAPLPDNPAQSRQGSGFLIGSTMITNAHVIGDSKWVQVLIDGKWQKVSTYQFVDAEADLAGFTVTGGKSLPYSTELPSVGDPVYSIGFPHGELRITDGNVYGITQGPNDITQITHTSHIENGNSGSFLLNGNGKIIGINSSVMNNNGEETSFSVPIRYALDELK